MELKICHLYPDILNLYGDRGNLISMENRLRRRGISAEIFGVSVNEDLKVSDYDMFFIGGGQVLSQETLLRDFHAKSKELASAAADGKTILAIDGGYQLLGRYLKTADGVQHDFAGILDVYTVEGKKRMTGDCALSWNEQTEIKIVGFENHAGKTYLGPEVRPLGTMLHGFGNNGEDGTEGACFNNVFASYLHGSLLPKNPALCDRILSRTLEYKYGKVSLEPLSDDFEMKAHAYMLNRLSK